MSISEIVPAEPSLRQEARRSGRAAPTAAAAWSEPALADIAPGQLWLIELSAAGDAAPQRVLDRANVVIYDRELGDLVAGALPLGGYAEPAAGGGAADDPAAARAIGFARDGWSVARLLSAYPTQRERIVRVRRLAEKLATTRAAADIPVTVLGVLGDGVCEPTETRLDRLDLVVVTYPRDARLTIVVDTLGGSAARLHAVAGNGLAG